MRTAQPFQISRSFLAAALVGTMQQRPPVQQPGPVPFTLQDGVVIDPVKGEAYVMAPTHAVRAIRLATGEAQWTSDAAAKPLAIADKLLVTQPEHTTQSNLLTLVALDPSRDGSPVRTAHAQLPTNVRVSLMQSTRGSFTVAGRNVLDAAIITWQSTVLPRQGAISRPTQTGARLGREGSAVNRLDSPVVTRGAFRFVPATGELTPVRLPSVADTSVSSVVAAAQPANAGPVPTLASGAPALASADGRHLMTYERIADDRTWEKYRWTIYDRATGIPVGRIRSFLPSAPFFVRDGRVFYTTGPYVLPGTGLEPPKLRAVDIGTGQEVWSAEIRDTSLHAPIPP